LYFTKKCGILNCVVDNIRNESPGIWRKIAEKIFLKIFGIFCNVSVSETSNIQKPGKEVR